MQIPKEEIREVISKLWTEFIEYIDRKESDLLEHEKKSIKIEPSFKNFMEWIESGWLDIS